MHDPDGALRDGLETVVDDLAEQGLSSLAPAFARAIAPLMVLLLDARKNAGESSDAWYFFAIRRDDLRAEVAAAGCRTGELLLWDRVGGRAN